MKKRCFFVLFAALVCLKTSDESPVQVNIGYFGKGKNSKYQAILNRIKESTNIPRGSLHFNLTFSFHELNFGVENSLQMYSEVCSFLSETYMTAVLLTDECEPFCDEISSLASQANIPVLRTEPGEFKYSEKNPKVYHLYPSANSLREAISSLMESYEINQVVLLCEENYCEFDLISKLSQILRLSITILPKDGDIKDVSSLVEDIESSKIKTIILQTSLEMIPTILNSALKKNIINFYYTWIIPKLGLEDYNLTRFAENTGVNLIVFNPLNQSEIGLEKNVQQSYIPGLIEDAIETIISAIENMYLGKIVTYYQNETDTCIGGVPISQRNNSVLLETISGLTFKGKTGIVGFFPDGRRILESIEMTNLGPSLVRVATWSREKGLTRYYEVLSGKGQCAAASAAAECKYGENPLRMATILQPPFVQYKIDHEEREGNDKYEGFLIDLMTELSFLMNFKYELYLVPDSSYGINHDGNWNGFIRELIDNKADVVLADLTITSAREEAVDFTVPYMYLGTDILIKKPSAGAPQIFSFLEPLSHEVWICVVASCIVLGFVLFFVNRISPYEWKGLHDRNKASQEDAKNFDLNNSLWFVAGALMQQGGDFTPRSTSGRIITGTWWFFVLVMTASYTANMASFLTVKKLQQPIESIEDLREQKTLKYGVPKNVQTNSFFRDSHIEPYRSMYIKMKEMNSFVENATAGVEKVCKENFVLLYDSVINAYVVNEGYCEGTLMTVGVPFDSKGYGIAFQRDSNMNDEFSLFILKLKEQEYIDGLMIKWQLATKLDNRNGVFTEQNVLGVDTLAGIFYLLLLGIVLGILFAIMENLWFNRNKKSTSSNSNKSNKDNSKDEENGQHSIQFLIHHSAATQYTDWNQVSSV